ncbi:MULTISPECIES: DUF3540 domain-containing protein [Sorangium]|uniref:DUF3540 domain-containing protein n=1 Tax=Sorangium cellulosum TaxID=56 RepID=A0A4P2R3E0_SORCE|nr:MULTISPECIES: DUF3540 domain-containing protein [Sorangium]AUX37101.1 hypothetical protein SOCE836_093210 [Sorangium cellulosum]WCQ96391.1 hypothetical protein NQZ70_09177 [Sorangium sp. Soce836]
MQSVARTRRYEREAHGEHGAVLRLDGSAYIVETEDGEVRAKRATSCLLEPATGDLVLLAVVNGARYILAVLEREEGAPSRLVAEGDLQIRLQRGALGLSAPDGVHVQTGKDLSMVASTFRVQAKEGHVALGLFSFVSKLVRGEVDRAKLVGRSLDAHLERLMQRVKRSYRIVEEADHVRADRIDYAAKGNLAIHSENAKITASHLVKIDGDQIQVG